MGIIYCYRLIKAEGSGWRLILCADTMYWCCIYQNRRAEAETQDGSRVTSKSKDRLSFLSLANTYMLGQVLFISTCSFVEESRNQIWIEYFGADTIYSTFTFMR